jgi:hypothetical protein
LLNITQNTGRVTKKRGKAVRPLVLYGLSLLLGKSAQTMLSEKSAVFFIDLKDVMTKPVHEEGQHIPGEKLAVSGKFFPEVEYPPDEYPVLFSVGFEVRILESGHVLFFGSEMIIDVVCHPGNNSRKDVIVLVGVHRILQVLKDADELAVLTVYFNDPDTEIFRPFEFFHFCLLKWSNAAPPGMEFIVDLF